jgi:hypothetical protein
MLRHGRLKCFEIVCGFLHPVKKKFGVLISWDNSFEFSVDGGHPPHVLSVLQLALRR